MADPTPSGAEPKAPAGPKDNAPVVIGKVDALQGEAWIIRGGQKLSARTDAPLLNGDEVETAQGAQISLVFADRSTFVLKDRGLIGLDDFAYDPKTHTGHESILVAKGAFSFVSGDIAKAHPDAARIATPVMSIGIRGTTVSGNVGTDGATSVALQADPGSNFVGEIVMSKLGSTEGAIVVNTAGSGVLGATSTGTWAASTNAGAAVATFAPPPAAPPAAPPVLPAAPAGNTGPSGGGDAPTGGANAAPGGANATEPGNGPAPAPTNAGGGEPAGLVQVAVSIPEPPPLPPPQPVIVQVSEPTPQTATTTTTTTTTTATTTNATSNTAGSVTNSAPVLGTVTLSSATEDTSRVLTTAELLGTTTDADGDTLSITGLTVSQGSITDNLDGTFTLTPPANFDGSVTLDYSVSDGTTSVATSTTMTVTAVNDVPIVSAAGTAASYTEGGAAAIVYGVATVADVDSAALSGATMAIANWETGDLLNFTDQSGITGSYNAATGVLTLTGSATPADYETALRSVTFSNSGITTSTSRTLTVTVTDGASTSAALNQTVDVTPADDTLTATAGIDALDGGDGSNTYSIAAGSDFAAGDSIADSGNDAGDVDTVALGAGATDLSVGTVTGVERITMAAAGSSVVLGGAASQFSSIVGGAGSDSVTLAASGTTLDLTGVTLSSVETVSTGIGNDTILIDDISAPGSSFLLDGDGSSVDFDKVIFTQTQAGSLDISGKTFSGIETIVLASGTTSGVTLIGGSQGQTLIGGAGDDNLVGGGGDDIISGGVGADVLTGGAGSDVFVYTSPTQSVDAMASRDTITDFATGTDHLRIALSGAHVDVSGFASVGSYNSGQATLAGGGVVGDGFYASFDQAFYIYVNGTTTDIGADGGYVIGSANTIAAADLQFDITGTSGNDTLVGGGGADRLVAGTVMSTLTGGGGTDAFVVNNSGSATITDFAAGTDWVDLSNAQFGLGGAGDLSASRYAESATAMSGSATDYGGGNTGAGLVAIDNGGNVELWSTTAMEAATTANSHLAGTLTGINTTALDNTSFHLTV